MQLIKKIFSSFLAIYAFIFLIAAITIILNTNFYLGLFIFLILGIIIVYLIKRGRRFDSKDKSSPSTCSLCEGQGRVRSKTKWFLTLESPCPRPPRPKSHSGPPASCIADEADLCHQAAEEVQTIG